MNGHQRGNRLLGLVTTLVMLAAAAAAPAADAAGSGAAGNVFRVSGSIEGLSANVPFVAYNTVDHEYLVVWSDDRRQPDRGIDVYAQRISEEGTRIGPNRRVSGKAAIDDEYVRGVVHNPLVNEYFVVWMDLRDDATRGSDIYGQRLAADGRRAGRMVRLSGNGATGYEDWPAVAFNSLDNEYLVGWVDGRDYPETPERVRVQRVSADGRRIGGNKLATDPDEVAGQAGLALAFNPRTGRYLAVWSDGRDMAKGRGVELYGQRLRADGRRMGSNYPLSPPGATASEHQPALAVDVVSGRFLLTWQDTRHLSTLGRDGYALRLSMSGRPLDAEHRVAGPGADGTPVAAFSTHQRRFVMVWSDARNEATRGADIYAQRLTAGGKLLAGQAVVCGARATGWDYGPAVAYGEHADRFLVVWLDGRRSADRMMEVYGRLWTG